jgi:hypothetical protein
MTMLRAALDSIVPGVSASLALRLPGFSFVSRRTCLSRKTAELFRFDTPPWLEQTMRYANPGGQP